MQTSLGCTDKSLELHAQVSPQKFNTPSLSEPSRPSPIHPGTIEVATSYCCDHHHHSHLLSDLRHVSSGQDLQVTVQLAGTQHRAVFVLAIRSTEHHVVTHRCILDLRLLSHVSHCPLQTVYSYMGVVLFQFVGQKQLNVCHVKLTSSTVLYCSIVVLFFSFSSSCFFFLYYYFRL